MDFFRSWLKFIPNRNINKRTDLCVCFNFNQCFMKCAFLSFGSRFIFFFCFLWNTFLVCRIRIPFFKINLFFLVCLDTSLSIPISVGNKFNLLIRLYWRQLLLDAKRFHHTHHILLMPKRTLSNEFVCFKRLLRPQWKSVYICIFGYIHHKFMACQNCRTKNL